jgi:hypothetical protein
MRMARHKSALAIRLSQSTAAAALILAALSFDAAFLSSEPTRASRERGRWIDDDWFGGYDREYLVSAQYCFLSMCS